MVISTFCTHLRTRRIFSISRIFAFFFCSFPRFRSRVINSNKKFGSKVFVYNYLLFSSISLFPSFDLFDSTLSIKTFRDIFDESSIPCDTKSTSTFFAVFHLDLSYRTPSIDNFSKFATMAYLVDVEDPHAESIDPRKSTSE